MLDTRWTAADARELPALLAARREQRELAEKLVAAWNDGCPVGTAVVVTRDNGEEQRTVTRSIAWQLPGGHPMVMVEGIRGAYSLFRVRKEEDGERR